MLINQLLMTETLLFGSIGCYSQKAEKKITYVFKENMVSNAKYIQESLVGVMEK